MKKILSLIIIGVFLLTVCGCSNNNNESTVETTQAIADIDGFEYAYFDKYNSYAEDNGLDGTEVYIKGTVKSVFEYSGFCCISVVSEDDGRWLVSLYDVVYSESLNSIFDEQKVTCFGNYRGYSDMFLMPSIVAYKTVVGNKTYDSENLNNSEATAIQEEATTVPITEEPTTEKVEKNTNKVIFDNMGVKITYTGIETDWYGNNIELLIENNSGHDYTFQVRDVSVNGYMIEPMFSCDVKNGKKANDGLQFSEDVLKDNGIENIEKIELSIHAFNWDDDSYDFDSEMIIFEP